jgi:hypothetical protein
MFTRLCFRGSDGREWRYSTVDWRNLVKVSHILHHIMHSESEALGVFKICFIYAKIFRARIIFYGERPDRIVNSMTSHSTSPDHHTIP